MIFNNFYFREFLSYDNDQAVKNHLKHQDNPFPTSKSVCAHLRAPRTPYEGSCNMGKFPLFQNFCGRMRGFRARNRARAQMVRANEFSINLDAF